MKTKGVVGVGGMCSMLLIPDEDNDKTAVRVSRQPSPRQELSWTRGRDFSCNCLGGCTYMARRRRSVLVAHDSGLEALISDSLSSVFPAGIFRADAAGRFLCVSARWCEIAGLPASEALGEGWARALHPDDRERVVTEWECASRESRGIESRFRFQRPDGAVALVLGQAQPEQDAQGKTVGFTGVITDLTHHIEAEHERRASQEDLERRNDELRRLALQLGMAEERERRRIAEGLHDHVGQLLAIARMKLAKLLELEARHELVCVAGEIVEVVDCAIRETRSLTFELSSPTLHELGLAAAVETLCEKLSEASGVRFDVNVSRPPEPLADDMRCLLYRAVRELCSNVVRHADAPRAEVHLHADPDRIWVVVDDDGKGFDSATRAPTFNQNGGFGLFAIRQMSSRIGGTFEVESAPGGGTLAVLSVPLCS